MSEKRRQLNIRLDPELYDRLQVAAELHDVSMTWLANRALKDFLAHLKPANEIRWTRGVPE